MGGNVIENSAVKVVSSGSRNSRVLWDNCALIAAGRAGLGHSWKAKAAVGARLHDDVNWIVARLGRRLGFELGEKSLDSIANLLLEGMKRCGKCIVRSRITAEAAVVHGPTVAQHISAAGATCIWPHLIPPGSWLTYVYELLQVDKLTESATNRCT
jgi:hypothetical protein